MNHPALEEALRDLAAGPSNAASVRAAVAQRIGARRRQRRSVALVATAAAVALIVGGIGVVAANRRTAPPAATQPDPHQNISGVSTLIPYIAPPLISPVTVTAGGPPADYVASRTTDVDTLQVNWPDADYSSPNFHGPVGYQVDRTAAFGSLRTTSGDQLTKPARVTSEQVVISGHRAEFNRTPDGTKQYFALAGLGNGVRMWLTWKLADGSYIHVWSTGDQRAELLALADGIVEKPSTLDSYLSLGLTLPGLTVRGTQGIRDAAQYSSGPLDETITLCPAGTSSVQAARSSGNRVCLTASAAPTSAALPGGEIVDSGGLSVHVLADQSTAWTDLGRGYTATVQGPSGMSTDDLVLAVASIRLDARVPDAPASSGAGALSSAAPTR